MAHRQLASVAAVLVASTACEEPPKPPPSDTEPPADGGGEPGSVGEWTVALAESVGCAATPEP
ncbi:MAG: hypothetical protein ABMA64_35190, partial [Myxococcota bacterium]